MNTFTSIPSIKFQNSKSETFSKLLKSRVNDYFEKNDINKFANSEMVIKTVFMYLLYFVPFAFLFTAESAWMFFLCYFLMGTGKAGIGLSVMHDANHGAYSNKKWVNQLVGYSLNVIGGNSTNWKIQHNVFHHTYTNISTHDEDIRPRFILRFSPHAERKSFHKYQHIYAWFLYGFMTFSWIIVKDFVQLTGYHKKGILQKYNNVYKAWATLIFTKIYYYSYIIVLPILFTPFTWWQVALGFLLMHYVAGFILAVIFQPAHVMEHNLYPEPNAENLIEENWMVHQLQTTCNFARKNKLLSWYVGGLNYQVEHHLFPSICHVHYKKIAEIVKNTAAEFNMPYHDIGSFREALVSHGKMLYQLGRA